MIQQGKINALSHNIFPPSYVEKKTKREIYRRIFILGLPTSILFFLTGMLVGIILERGGI